MSFSRKVFFGIFFSTLIVGSVLIWAAHQLVSAKATESYLSRYTVFSRVLGQTLNQLERNTEALMFNAAQVVVHEQGRGEPMQPERLKALARKLDVTHIFEVNSKGEFIRSTNEDPKLIPNLFSFCGEYRNFLRGPRASMLTPIIPPAPEPNPYKFLFVRDETGTRLIEVGVRVEFLGRTLTTAIKDDPNVLGINLYAPDGTTLGSFSRSESQYHRAKVALPEPVESVVQEGDQFRTFLKVDSGQTRCCQCDTAGISRNGEYYYVFESVISKRELGKTLASIRHLFLALEGIALLVAFLAATWISSRLVSRVRLVKERVRTLGSAGDLGARIGLGGSDEISFLANEFDGLLGRLEKSQGELLDSQKKAAFGEFAGQVAHNIGTPVRALEMMLPVLKHVPDQHRRVIGNAVKEIRDMVRTLRAQSDRKPSETSQEPDPADAGVDRQGSVELLSELVEAAVSESRAQFRDRPGVEIGVDLDERGYGLFSEVETTEFKMIVANLVKNGVEALDEWDGVITVSLKKERDRAVVEVEDDGKGIPAEVIAQLGPRGATFGKQGGSGIGLYHAVTTVRRWGGDMTIKSIPGKGTKIRLKVPLAEPPEWFVPAIELEAGGNLVVLDDDTLSRQIWRSRLSDIQSNVHLRAFREGRELREWIEENGAQKTVFLVDLELSASGEDGLRLIEVLGIAESSILATGHFGVASVMARARWLGVRVLPKSLVPWVPIRIQSQPRDESQNEGQIKLADVGLHGGNPATASAQASMKFD